MHCRHSEHTRAALRRRNEALNLVPIQQKKVDSAGNGNGVKPNEKKTDTVSLKEQSLLLWPAAPTLLRNFPELWA